MNAIPQRQEPVNGEFRVNGDYRMTGSNNGVNGAKTSPAAANGSYLDSLNNNNHYDGATPPSSYSNPSMNGGAEPTQVNGNIAINGADNVPTIEPNAISATEEMLRSASASISSQTYHRNPQYVPPKNPVIGYAQPSERLKGCDMMEERRKDFRTVYSHDDWVEHRSSERYNDSIVGTVFFLTVMGVAFVAAGFLTGVVTTADNSESLNVMSVVAETASTATP